MSPRPGLPRNPAQSTRGVGHSDDLCVCLGAGERWGGGGFPWPLLVRTNREKRESRMQTASTRFGLRSLPLVGTASGKLRTNQQLYKHGNHTCSTCSPRPTANGPGRAPTSACARLAPPRPPRWANQGTAQRQVLGSLSERAGEGSFGLGPSTARPPFPRMPILAGGALI